MSDLRERIARMRAWQEFEVEDFRASDLEAVLTAAEKRAEWEAEQDGRRWFTPAYQSTSGNIIAFGDETVVQEHAQRYADQFAREDPEGPDYFVATRILPPWMPVEQEGEQP